MNLANKKILVVGLGTTGVAVARFLTRARAAVTVTDSADSKALGKQLEIKQREAAAAELEKDKAELVLRIVSLERRCVKLDGRRAEREDACAELRKTLDERSRQ